MYELQKVVDQLENIVEKMQGSSSVQIGIWLTFLIGIINIVITVHKNNVEGITNKRAQWVNDVRNVGTVILQYDPRMYDDEKNIQIAKIEIMKNVYKLNMLLNVTGALDGVVLDYLCEYLRAIKIGCQNDDDRNEFLKCKRKLKYAIQIYLKSEWNRVKRENGIRFKLYKGEKWFRSIYKYRVEKYNENIEINRLIDRFPAQNQDIQDIKEDFNKYIADEKVFCRDFTDILGLSIKMTSHASIVAEPTIINNTPPDQLN